MLELGCKNATVAKNGLNKAFLVGRGTDSLSFVSKIRTILKRLLALEHHGILFAEYKKFNNFKLKLLKM